MNYTRLSIYTISTIFIITAILGYFAISRIKFDFDMRNFYPLNNPETEFFYQYTNEFGWDDDYILIGLETKGKYVFRTKISQSS